LTLGRGKSSPGMSESLGQKEKKKKTTGADLNRGGGSSHKRQSAPERSDKPAMYPEGEDNSQRKMKKKKEKS